MPESLEACQKCLGYKFRDEKLLLAALTHASSANTRLNSNERLELLGDAVLGLVVLHDLYDGLPAAMEGEMTKIKSSVVSRRTCAAVAERLGLGRFIILGAGMENSGELPSSLLAGTLEAVIGAIYLDGKTKGLDAARKFVLKGMREHIDSAAGSEHQFNFKSQLQQWSQGEGVPSPKYEMLDEKGPDHAKCFEIAVAIGTRQFPSAWGKSKKEAEQRAAWAALVALQALPAGCANPFDAPEALPE